ncbi:PTB-containing, cubilin and LRP1-interacting protein [Moschus berezovskii]|uniref:PTB-containing, cubilin and LRP1-interacting protein n=1 Tax=Moschus berezovskii TaxID=68408 RepID=UPI002443A49E|nr:PTB-containing, cubilin and LRP1-interacting protein [Moschus berezovskii]
MLRALRSGRRRRRRGRRERPPPPCARGPGRSCAVLSQLRQDSRRAAVPTSCRPPSAAPPPRARRPESPPRGDRRLRDAPPADAHPRCEAGPQPLAAPYPAGAHRQSLASVSSAQPRGWKMWQPATERLQHFQTMLKSKLNVLTLKKEPLPAVIFHEPEAIELCTTTPLMKSRTQSGCKVTYLGKVPTTGVQFLSGCTEKPVIELWKKHTLAREDVFPANALLEIRPFQVWLHHLDHKGEATVHMDTFQVARIAYCTADHNVSPSIFAWVYREINDDLSYQMDCHAVECESKLEAKKLAHAMMEAFKKTFHSMKSDGRIHRNSSSEEVSQELESDDG